MSTEAAKRGVARIEGFLDLMYDGNEVLGALADLRHYCDAKGLNFGDADQKAYKTYLMEIIDET